MADPLVTLTTDFGAASPYVAAMKGVLLGINPAVRIVDLSHEIPPQDLRHAAYFFATSLPYFPETALHVVVIDPGVGTERALLYVEIGGRRLLVPDNGCWTWLPDKDWPPLVVRLAEMRYWRSQISATFHGRDILAPVAGLLTLGVKPRSLGPVLREWVVLPRSQPKGDEKQIRGEVEFVDRFGNLITNIPRSMMDDKPQVGRCVVVGNAEVSRWVRAYGEAEPGALVALFSSEDRLEVAVAQGNAARRLGVGLGAQVVIVIAPEGR